jgi:NADH-quinone oxidoreductase subunit J
MLLVGAEFIAMLLVIVYVGAVAVLFLFVVMMLDINFVALRQGFVRYLPIGAIVGVILVAELVFIFGGWVAPKTDSGVLAAATPALAQATNTQALGQLLYTKYFYLFQAAGMILLVSMIGAIVLTHRERVGVKRQRIATQLERGRDSVEIKNVPSGSGV